MRTTIILSDELFTAVKKRAVELRCSFDTLIARALRRELASEPPPQKPLKLEELKPLPGFEIEDPDALVHIDWSGDWKPASKICSQAE